MKPIRTCFLLMAALCSPVVMAGCSSAPAQNDSQSSTAKTFADAQELLDDAWNKMEEDTKPSIFGGMGEDLTEGMPMAVSLDDPKTVSTTFNVPETLVENSTSASAMVNAMMANAFTVSAWQLKDGADQTALKNEIQHGLDTAQWMCTFPEVCVVGTYENDLIVAYGYTDQIEPFVDALRKTCPGIQIETSVFEG